MPFDVDPLYVFYAAAAIAAVLAAEAAYLLFSSTKDYRTGVNRRLAIASKEGDREKVLLQLRRERGLSAGNGSLRGALSRLFAQSGLRLDPGRIALVLVAIAVAGFAAGSYPRGEVTDGLMGAGAALVLVPFAVLHHARKRRQRRFGEQFPEAIDIIVRSLRAGHPVPVAIAMVAREMPDPVGTEFGMVADEITYGADLEGALRSMAERVGTEDLPLFVTSVSIQASTGGNLSQILDNLGKVIRERFKMRRKIRGLSAEGRVSAWILNLTPIIVFTIINLISPSFYGDVWSHPKTPYVFGGAAFWMLVGNLIMRKMINFKF